jgi:hypothetical protein
MVLTRKLSPSIISAQPLRARRRYTATAAIRHFDAIKSRVFICSIIENYANGARMQQRRGLLIRGLAFISSHPSAFVNSPLQCWALDGEWARLQKSLCARVGSL